MKKDKRFKILKNGYKFDKNIFRTTIVFILIGYILLLISMNFDFKPQVYFTCPEFAEAGGCENPFLCDEFYCPDLPFYVSDDVRSMKYLPQGFEYGKKPSNYYKFFPYWITFMITWSFIMNHLIHNRRKKK